MKNKILNAEYSKNLITITADNASSMKKVKKKLNKRIKNVFPNFQAIHSMRVVVVIYSIDQYSFL